jgi:hypothetical protein
MRQGYRAGDGPGYTGTHPRDLRRELADPKGNLRLYVSLDELEELVAYAIASYHGTPHAGLNNVTPLEAMEYFIRGKQVMVTWLAEHHRRTNGGSPPQAVHRFWPGFLTPFD